MTIPETTPAAPMVFISYSHKDEEWKDRLVSHLGVSQRQGLLFAWEDHLIGGGEDWFGQIQAAMNAARVAILLVSANSLTSDFILNEEVKRLLQRRDKEGLRIFPVIIKPCDWEAISWLRGMNLRPRDGRAISGGSEYHIDTDFKEIAKEIRQLLGRHASQAAGGPRRPLPPEDISVGRLPVTSGQLFGRQEELKALDEAWEDGGTHVLSFVAWGGVGKSALVNHWLARMARDDYRGATRVYGWSFYSQGTSNRASSADQFIEAALVWMRDPEPNKGTSWDKGERLARMLGAQRAFLILDGLDPLQHPPGTDEGRLRDPAIQALLRQLAAYNEGLCVITTRVAVTDLSSFEGSTVERIDLDHLTAEAGARLLTAQGVRGTQAELEHAATEFGAHPLALILLGSYLNEVCGGDVRRYDEVRQLEEDARYGGQARRVMSSYEEWFGESPELAVLRVLGLFDRPAGRDAVEAVRRAPGITGLTDSLQNLKERDWWRALANLRRAKLLSEPYDLSPETLDTHPLVREHFGQQLKRDNPEAWRDGNDRLYEHLKQAAKHLPDTVEEMAPLYAAVTHGCRAGHFRDALLEVYWRRIQRGEESFNTVALGAVGAELAVLSNFFITPWMEPVPELGESLKSHVLNEVGVNLQSLGRLREAVRPIKEALESRIRQESWENAARNANNLSEVFLVLGDINQALLYAVRGVMLAINSGRASVQVATQVTRANALHQAGRTLEAEDVFRKAEAQHKEKTPEFPILYSVGGCYYCDLLLSKGLHQEVKSRAARTLEIAAQNRRRLDVALSKLSLGSALLLQTLAGGDDCLAEASLHFDGALDGLREAGHLVYLPRGLLARVELHRAKGDYAAAWADLEEVVAISDRDGMGLYLADYHLECARVHLAQGEEERACASLGIAEEMIERMGYSRRLKDALDISHRLHPLEEC